MKNRFLLLSTLFICHQDFSQTASSRHTFGEGIITVKQYSFPPSDTTLYAPASLANQKNSLSMVYFIKCRKIVRKDEKDRMNSTHSTDTTRMGDRDVVVSLNAEVALQHYLIDLDKKTTYIFFTKNNQPQLSETSLKDQPLDPFYRYIESNVAAVTSPDQKTPVFIAGKKCFKGAAIATNGDSLLFYYTETPLKVRSPLNGFFSPSLQCSKYESTSQLDDGRRQAGCRCAYHPGS